MAINQLSERHHAVKGLSYEDWPLFWSIR